MRDLQPVDVVLVGVEDIEGTITDETMFHRHTAQPAWSTGAAAAFFFGKGEAWLRRHITVTPFIRTQPTKVPYYRANTDAVWHLHHIESIAHELARGGYLSITQLVRTLRIVKLVAQSWGFIPGEPIRTEVMRHDPERDEVMALEEQEILYDDLDKTPGATTRHFALGETVYTIDLTDKHFDEMLAAMRPYLKVAQLYGHRFVNNSAQMRDHLAVIRQWARDQGYPVGVRGRVPQGVLDEYAKAHPRTKL